MTTTPLPWIYPYTVDETAARDGRDVPRPIVPLRILGVDLTVQALVDSGSDHVLIAPFLARALNLPPAKAGEGFLLGVGGERQWVRTEWIRLQLLHPQDQRQHVEWEVEVGVVNHWPAWFSVLLGQKGFFDRFTVTMHRGIPAIAIDQEGRFEARYGQFITVDGVETHVTPY